MNRSQQIRHSFAKAVEYWAHPLFLAGALALWWVMGRGDEAALVALISALVLMGALELLVPAVPGWHQTRAEKLRIAGVYAMTIVLQALLVSSYESVLRPALLDFRVSAGAQVWPSDQPILLQVVLLYFASDFIYYWIHRGIHRWPLFWRMSGHGFHHAFHNLHAINVGATHPFEVVFLALPMVLLAAIFGAPAEAVSGAVVLLVVNATLAHANIRMETPFFSWFFTCSNQHRRHHSAVFAESNTNYACNAILWDRLFGTYSSGSVQQTGIGPNQPAVRDLFMLPMREPRDADTVATRASKRSAV